MTTLASLRILLGLEAPQVKTGANSVRSDLKSVQAEANRTNATLRDIGKGVGAGLGIGLGFGAFQLAAKGAQIFTDVLADGLHAAIEDEASIARLTQGLKANIPAWDQNTDAVEKAIAAGQHLGFTDDEVRDSAVRLSAATHDLGKALAIQNTAMDLARFKGISLGDATSALTKIEAGRFRALAELGIVLEKGATQTEALAAVQKVAGGQAEAFANTTAGAMAEANVAVDELKESIGKGLILAVKDFGGALNDLKPAIDLLLTAANVLLTPVKQVNEESDKVKAFAAELKKNAEAAAPGLAAQARAYDDLNVALIANQAAFADGTITEKQYRDASDALNATFVKLSANTSDFTNVAEDLAPHVLAVAEALSQADDNAAGWVASATKAAVVTSDLSAAQIAVAQATIDAGRAHADLAEAQKAAGDSAVGDMSAVVDLARAQAADKVATDALRASQDALAASLLAIPAAMLGAGNGTDALSDKLLTNANAATIAADALRDYWEAGQAQAGRNVTAEFQNRMLGGNPDDAATNARLNTQNLKAIDERDKAAADAADRERDRQNRAKSDADAAASAAKRNADDLARTYHDKLGKAFDDVATRAHDAFAKIHDDNLKAIDDVRDLANAALNEQERTIRGAVDAARAQVAAKRTARQLDSLRSAVAGASPEDLAVAKQALGDFLDDQRLAFLGSQADTQIAALEAEKTKNDAVAALATAAENQRFKDQEAARAKDLASLKEHLAAYTGAWSKAFADIAAAARKYHVDDLTGIKPTVATSKSVVGVAPKSAPTVNPAVAGVGTSQPVINVVVHNYLDGQELTGHVNTRMAVSNSRVTSGGIAG